MLRFAQTALVLACLLAATLGAATVAQAGKKAKKNSVVSKSIKNGQVKTKDLAAAAVTAANIAGEAVSAAAVDPRQIQLRLQGACPGGQAVSAVGEDGSLSCVAVGGGGSATPTGPAGGSLTGTYPNPAIAAGAIAAPELGQGAVTSGKISDLAVLTAALADGSVTGPKLAGDAVDSSKVTNDSLTGSDIDESTLNGLWRLNGNAGTDPATNFLGTTNNQPLVLKVNDTRALRVEPTSGTPNLIGGSPVNTVSAGVVGGVIAGGGVGGVSQQNHVNGNYGTVGGGSDNGADRAHGTVSGGEGNTAVSVFSTVGGGIYNVAGSVPIDGFPPVEFRAATVSGGELNVAGGQHATVAGGLNNVAQGFSAVVGGGSNNHAEDDTSVVSGGSQNDATGLQSVVAGGAGNTASGPGAVVSGGDVNTASGLLATALGGAQNNASGNYSVAAGRRAKATTNGTFVFADSSNFDFTPTASNQFSVRSTGGVRFVSGIDAGGVPNAGVQLNSGSSAWQVLSDRNSKTAIEPVNGREVLSKLAELPIKTWSWKTERGVTHMGPMAQDFSAAFGLGPDDKTITSVDPDGVALAAIQGLESELRAERAKRADLERRLADLERRIGAR